MVQWNLTKAKVLLRSQSTKLKLYLTKSIWKVLTNLGRPKFLPMTRQKVCKKYSAFFLALSLVISVSIWAFGVNMVRVSVVLNIVRVLVVLYFKSNGWCYSWAVIVKDQQNLSRVGVLLGNLFIRLKVLVARQVCVAYIWGLTSNFFLSL